MKTLRLYIVAISLLMPSIGLACGGFYVDWDSQNLFLLEKPLDAWQGYEKYKNASYEETLDFWCRYVNNALSREDMDDAICYMDEETLKSRTTDNKLVKLLRLRGDNAALRYLRLNAALNAKTSGRDSWNYSRNNATPGYAPLWSELSRLPATGKLKERINFLKMRCLFAMGRYNECLNLWKANLPGDKATGIGRRMYGYVAGVYVKQKKYNQALKIYYELGDNLSIHKCVDALMSKGGMDILQQNDVNSLALRYVAQDYANYYYHYRRNLEWSRQNGYGQYLEAGGVWERVKRDYDSVVSLAKGIAQNPRTENKMFWNAFVGYMIWVNGDGDEAYRYLAKAEESNGPARMRDNVRSLKVLAALSAKHHPSDMDNLLIGEYKRMYEISVKEYDRRHARSARYNDNSGILNPSWIIFSHEMHLAAKEYYEEEGAASVILNVINNKYNYENIYFTKSQRVVSLDRDTDVKALEALLKAKQTGGGTRAEKELLALIASDDLLDENMLHELLGTKYLRENNYSAAIEHLQKVSLQYESSLSIAPYLENRKMTKNMFRRTQRGGYWDEGPWRVTRHAKLEFARAMLQLQEQYNNATGEAKARTAYEMANWLYQASPLGDLWAISDYQWSSYIEANAMNREAEKLLRTVIQITQDTDLKKKACFALALVTADTHNNVWWNYDNKKWSFDNVSPAQKYAYSQLKNLVSKSDNLYRSCDVLRYYINHY